MIRFSVAEKIRSTFEESFDQLEEIIEQLTRRANVRMNIDDIESIVNREGRELERKLLEKHISYRGFGDVGSELMDNSGVKRTYKIIRQRKLMTIFGEVCFKRVGYYKPGIPCIFPLDAQMNLPKSKYSYLLQKYIVHDAVRNSYSEVIDSIRRTTGLTISKSNIENIIRNAARYFDEYYSLNKEIHKVEGQSILVLSIDGKGVAMKTQDLRECTKLKLIEERQSNKSRLMTGEKKNKKRMAAVASVYYINRFKRTSNEVVKSLFDEGYKYKNDRPAPISKRIWASIEKGFNEVVGEIFTEAKKRDPTRKHRWIALVDGNRNQINYLKTHAGKHSIDLTIVCDIIHVIEYIWNAAHVFYEDQHMKQAWVREKVTQILLGKSSSVAGGMRRSATRKNFISTKREPIDKCCNYLLNLSPYLQYDKYIKNGYPVATGVIEGACGYLVKDRMGKSGARWCLGGAESILKLRSILVSDDFEDYWHYYKKKEFYRIYGKIANEQNVIAIDQNIVN